MYENVKKAFENIEQIEKTFESLASAFEEMFEEINKKEFDDFLEENKAGIDKQIEKLCKTTKEGIERLKEAGLDIELMGC